MFKVIKTIIIVAVTLVFLDFAIVNRETVHISLFPLPVVADMPQFLLTIICFTLGVIIGGFAVNLKLLKSSRQYRAEHSRVKALENEIAAMQEEQHSTSSFALSKGSQAIPGRSFGQAEG